MFGSVNLVVFDNKAASKKWNKNDQIFHAGQKKKDAAYFELQAARTAEIMQWCNRFDVKGAWQLIQMNCAAIYLCSH